jgi:hypothetical protein
LLKIAGWCTKQQGIAIIELCPDDAATNFPSCFVRYDIADAPQCSYVVFAGFGTNVTIEMEVPVEQDPYRLQLDGDCRCEVGPMSASAEELSQTELSPICRSSTAGESTGTTDVRPPNKLQGD